MREPNASKRAAAYDARRQEEARRQYAQIQSQKFKCQICLKTIEPVSYEETQTKGGSIISAHKFHSCPHFACSHCWFSASDDMRYVDTDTHFIS